MVPNQLCPAGTVVVGIGDEGRLVCEPLNFPPIAKAQANPATGLVPLMASFDASASIDIDGDFPLSYLWDFGDGGSSTDPSPVHTYSTSGIFIATLTVTDSRGATSIPAILEVDVQEDLGPVTPSNAGDLVITEIMNAPASLSQNVGEYFEIYNPTATEFTLRGCRITASDGSHDITTDVIIEPDVYAVLAISMGAIPPSQPDYNYAGAFNLDDTADTIELACNGAAIDTVAYDGSFPVAREISMNLDPAFLDANSNDDGLNWYGTPPGVDILNDRDAGTPGAPNGICP
jgi:PKD repeat protein